MLELGDPGSYTPDTGSDAEADSIINQGNARENGDPPWTSTSGNGPYQIGDSNKEEAQRQCAAGSPAACD